MGKKLLKLLLLGLGVLLLLGVVVTGLSLVIGSDTDTRLEGNVELEDGKLMISNNDTEDWEDCQIVLNDKWKKATNDSFYLFKDATVSEILFTFTDAEGNKFNLADEQPEKVSITCNNGYREWSLREQSAKATMNEELLEKQLDEISNLFCEVRSKPSATYVNLSDFIEMCEKAGKTVTLRQVSNVKPSSRNCEKAVEICLTLWSSEDCKGIAEQKIWIGMDKDQLILSIGPPNRTNNSTYSWGVNSQWVYGDPLYGPIYVYLEGKDKSSMIVTSWQD